MGDHDRDQLRERDHLRLTARVLELEQRLAESSHAWEVASNEPADERARVFREAERIAHVGTWVWDVSTKRIGWSEELFRILGYDPRHDAPSLEAYYAAVHPEDREGVRARGERWASGDIEPSEYRVLRRDGEVRHVLANGSVIRDQHGVTVKLLGTALDVTERVKLEEQFLRASKLEALGTLAGGVAHDFNNLLTVIFGNVDLLRAHVMPRGLPHLLGIEQAAELAGQLTSELLAFGRKAPLERRVLDLNALLADAVRIAGRLIGESVSIVTSLESDLWSVSVDRGQLHQIVLNLAVNARDAMPNGGTIRFATRNVVLDKHAQGSQAVVPGDYVVLEVADQGVGMDAQTRARMFEPFFTTKPAARGAGLGLAVVFGAVAQHGGTVEVDSRQGEGTTFRVYFPRAQAEPMPVAVETSPRPAELAATESARVLLVEDDTAVAAMMATTLKAAGYDVSVVHLAADALALLEREGSEFELVISDVVMPGMRGPALIERLRAGGRLRRALFVTGYGPELFGDAADTRQHAVLAKPFNSSQLLSKVRELLAL